MCERCEATHRELIEDITTGAEFCIDCSLHKCRFHEGMIHGAYLALKSRCVRPASYQEDEFRLWEQVHGRLPLIQEEEENNEVM